MFLKKSKWIKHIYLRLLYREGRCYKNSNIYILDGSAKSTEERALTKIAHLIVFFIHNVVIFIGSVYLSFASR